MQRVRLISVKHKTMEKSLTKEYLIIFYRKRSGINQSTKIEVSKENTKIAKNKACYFPDCNAQNCLTHYNIISAETVSGTLRHHDVSVGRGHHHHVRHRRCRVRRRFGLNFAG